MTKELVISSNRHETKVAILEDDQLVEIYFQRSNEYSLVGSIHKGRVTRVLPGMQSAFVELGLERDAFLYVSDFFEEAGEDYERVGVVTEGGRRRGSPPVIPAAVPVAAPVEAAEEPARDRDRDGDRDASGQRGRRSRRRRSRSRGFPDNKYASPETPSQTAAPIVDPEPPAPADDLEALVLPGESLAKYRDRSNAAIEPEDEVDLADAEPNAISGNGDEEAVAIDDEVLAAEALDELPEEPPVASGEPGDSPDEPEPELEMAIIAPEPGDLDEAADSDGSPEASDDEASNEDASGAEASDDEASANEASLAEPLAASPDSGEAAVSEAEVLDADLREQATARYIVRGPRRIRRRGGRDPRLDLAERPSPGRPDHHTVARPDRDRARDKESESTDRDRADRDRLPLPSIADLLKEGQEIIVQIAKEPLGQKGARITSRLAIPGRYVVYMPTIDHQGGVSRKISTDDERQRLKRILQTHSKGMTGGFIVRTAGEGRSESEIAADMNYLYNQWLDIRKKAEKRAAPVLLHHDLELVTRTVRDQVGEHFKAIWVDSEDTFENILHFLERFQPALVSRVKLYTRPMPIFDTFNITAELEKALRPKVWLKSGGYIVINQTEALVAVDINTGKYVGKSNRLEDTIVKTNIEAVKEIVRQIRLRDLGGIIVVDFIDMEERKNRQKVMQALEEAMRTDRAPYKILQFNDFGLVAITRRRVKQSLERALCSSCPTCEGAGYVKSVSTVAGEIINEAHKIAKAVEGADVILRVNPEVARFLKANQEHFLEELEEILGKQVLIKSDPLLHPEKFDLA